MRHSLSCACATNCFAHAHTIALCMFAQLLCACPIYTSHRHAHAIALHMRKPLLCTCASYCFAHARPIALHMRAPLYRARPQFANMRPGGCHPVFIVPLAHWCSLPLLATIVLVLVTILVVLILCTLQVLLCLFL